MADKASFVFSAFFTVLGLGLLIAGSIFLYQGFSSNSWDSTVGTIVTSYGHPSTEHPGEIGRVDIEYKYEVDGQMFTNERISFNMGQPASSQALLDFYKEGEIAEVFYDPGEPGRAVLIIGAAGTNFILPSGGLVFVLAGVFLFMYEMKRRKNEITLADKINQARKEVIAVSEIREIRTFNKGFSYPKYITSKVGAVFAIILGLFVIAFPVTASIIFREQEGIEAAYIVSGVFGAAGLFIIFSSVNTMYSRISVIFSGEMVELKKRSLFRRASFKENIRNYTFITPKLVMDKSQFGSVEGSKYYYHIIALLIHRETHKRDVGVRLNTRPKTSVFNNSSLLSGSSAGQDFADIGSKEAMNSKVEQFAKKLSLPVKRFS